MRDDGGGALSAITVSSRELVVRGAAGAGLGRGRAAAQLQRAGLLAHELLGLLHPAPGAARVLRRRVCVCMCMCVCVSAVLLAQLEFGPTSTFHEITRL